MRIALIRCPWIPVSSYPPDIGFAYIATILKKSGHELSTFDLNIEFYHMLEEIDKEILNSWNSKMFLDFGESSFLKYEFIFNDAINRILKFNPDIVGFCVWETNKLISLELVRRIKENNSSLFTIFGGPDCYPLFSGREFAKNPAVELVIYGEAEITVRKVLDSIDRKKEILPLPGTITKNGDRVIDGGWGELVGNLDQLPFLDLVDFPLDLYTQRVLPISFSRGCIYKCEYCPREMYPVFRCRSAEKIVHEIKFLQKNFSPESFLVCDSTIMANLAQITKLCDLILVEGLKVSFGGFASTHLGLNYKLLTKMKKAGFNSFVYGVESGSEKILRRFGKKIELKTIERVIRDTYEAGIEIGVDILVGLPGESEDDFAQSIDFIIRNRSYIKRIGINNFGLEPYSYMFSHVKNYEFISEQLKLERTLRLKEIIGSLGLSETLKSDFLYNKKISN